MSGRTALFALISVFLAAPQSPLPPTVSTYDAKSATDWPRIGGPAAQHLVFRNGLFQVPDLDYKVVPAAGGARLEFANGRMKAGDRIEVVTLPLNTLVVGHNVVHNEEPAPVANASRKWTLAHIPISNATCFRNGLRQTPGTDYTLVARTITSNTWKPGDTLACDYEW